MLVYLFGATGIDIIYLTMGIIGIFPILFIREFVDQENKFKYFWRFVFAVIAYNIVASICYYAAFKLNLSLEQRTFAYSFFGIGSLFLSTIISAFTIYISTIGHPGGRTLLICICPSLLSIAVVITMDTIAIEKNFWVVHALEIGSTISAILFSIAAANQYRQMKEQLIATKVSLNNRLKNVLEVSRSLEITTTREASAIAAYKYMVAEVPSLGNLSVYFQQLDQSSMLPINVTDRDKGSYSNTSISKLLETSFSKDGHFYKLDQDLVFRLSKNNVTYGHFIIHNCELESFRSDEIFYMENVLMNFSSVLSGMDFVDLKAKQVKLESELEAAHFVQEALLSQDLKIPNLKVLR